MLADKRSVRTVWGPEPIRLGFIGAPIATAISFNLISIISIMYGLFFVPKTAWHPLSSRCFTSLGVLVQLGLSGVGQVASEWWSWELVGRKYLSFFPARIEHKSNGFPFCSGCQPVSFPLMRRCHFDSDTSMQARSHRTCNTIRFARFGFDNIPGPVCFERGVVCSVRCLSYVWWSPYSGSL